MQSLEKPVLYPAPFIALLLVDRHFYSRSLREDGHTWWHHSLRRAWGGLIWVMVLQICGKKRIKCYGL